MSFNFYANWVERYLIINNFVMWFSANNVTVLTEVQPFSFYRNGTFLLFWSAG